MVHDARRSGSVAQSQRWRAKIFLTCFDKRAPGNRFVWRRDHTGGRCPIRELDRDRATCQFEASHGTTDWPHGRRERINIDGEGEQISDGEGTVFELQDQLIVAFTPCLRIDDFIAHRDCEIRKRQTRGSTIELERLVCRITNRASFRNCLRVKPVVGNDGVRQIDDHACDRNVVRRLVCDLH